MRFKRSHGPHALRPPGTPHTRCLRRLQKWNGGELPPKYYAGELAAPAAARTRHVWGFANKLSQADKDKLEDARESTLSQTNKPKPNASGLSVAAARRQEEAAKAASAAASLKTNRVTKPLK